MNLLVRKSVRLQNFDYRTEGAYFITICTQDRQCVLSEIVGEGLAPPAVKLTAWGNAARMQIEQITARFPSIFVDHYVIMPNHIHLLLRLDAGGASPSPTMIDAVRVMKSQTTRLCRGTAKLFQRSFYDHVIRNQAEYQKIWEYIDTNPLKWADDCLHP